MLRVRFCFRLLRLFRMMLFARILLLVSVICAINSVRTFLIINSNRKSVPQDRLIRPRNRLTSFWKSDLKKDSVAVDLEDVL